MTLSLMRDLRACFGAAVRPGFIITIYLIFSMLALFIATSSGGTAIEGATYIWSVGVFFFSAGLGFGSLSLALVARELRLPAARSVIAYAMSVAISVMLVAVVAPGLTMYALTGLWMPAAVLANVCLFGLLFAVIWRWLWVVLLGVAFLPVAELPLRGDPNSRITLWIAVAAVQTALACWLWHAVLSGDIRNAMLRRYARRGIAMSYLAGGNRSEPNTVQFRSGNSFAVLPSVTPESSPIKRIRTLLGTPYAPMKLARRIKEVGLCLLIVGGATWTSRHFVPVGEDGATPWPFLPGYILFFCAISFDWRLPLVLTPRCGTLTDLALLPGLGTARTQLWHYYAAAFLPTALRLLLWLGAVLLLGALLRPQTLPHWNSPALVILYLTLLLNSAANAAQALSVQGRDPGRFFRLGCMTYVTSLTLQAVGLTAASLSPVQWIPLAAIWLFLATTIWRAHRQLAARPHPFLEVAQ